MKKILVLFILSYGQLVALDKESTLNFYQHIFTAITSAHPVFVYVEDPEYREVFLQADKILLAKRMKGADVLLLTSKAMLEKVLHQKELHLQEVKKPLLFATDYHILKASKEVIGAFYWKKGRAQLLFVKSRLKAHGIVLSSEYQKFIIDEL
ncbi:MAG TPA: hypothetical protein ENK39_08535 [Epsilonproteobacteria bacterium]|nr:hypothetical protein [Campylobacterota bacterium]